MRLADTIRSSDLFARLQQARQVQHGTLLECWPPNDALQESIRYRVDSLAWALSHAQDGMRDDDVRHLIETGTAKGYFALLVQHVVRAPWRLVTCDVSPAVVESVSVLHGSEMPVDFVLGDSLVVLPEQLRERNGTVWTFAWVDGCHDYQHALGDISAVLSCDHPPRWVAVDDAVERDVALATNEALVRFPAYELTQGPWENHDHCRMKFLTRKGA